jgi:uncharacterized membrane-anchored protein
MPKPLVVFAAWLVIAITSSFGARTARAESHPAPSASASAQESAEPSLHLNWLSGPRSIPLGHDLTLKLPERHVFVNGSDASKLLEKNGSFHNEDVVGLVVGKADDAKWFVVIRYEDEGYIKDTDSIDADELLKSMKEGTEAANEERKSRGFPPFHVEGWSEAPHYDRSVHHLVWALTVKGDDGESVNYNTRILGRKGVVSLNLVCDPSELAGDRPEIADLLAGTAFDKGQRYEDFNSKTDKIAEYGLAGLILGGIGLGAAKVVKIGLLGALFAKFGTILLAAKKLILFVFVGIAAMFKRIVGFFKGLFGRKDPPEAPAQPPSPAP